MGCLWIVAPSPLPWICLNSELNVFILLPLLPCLILPLLVPPLFFGLIHRLLHEDKKTYQPEPFSLSWWVWSQTLPQVIIFKYDCQRSISWPQHWQRGSTELFLNVIHTLCFYGRKKLAKIVSHGDKPISFSYNALRQRKIWVNSEDGACM